MRERVDPAAGLRRLVRPVQVLLSSQQNSVATDNRQIICTTIWQRISPFVVPIFICPAYIVSTSSSATVP